MKSAGKQILKTIIFMILICLTAMPVQAAVTKQQALNNYAKQMAKKSSKLYFTIADIDGNGVPELINGQANGTNDYLVQVAGINGKIVSTAKYSSKQLEFGYCPGRNRGVVINKTGTSAEYRYLTISGQTVKEVFICGFDTTQSVPFYWESLSTHKKTRVTEGELRSLLMSKVGTTSYNKIKFYANTAANRKNIFGTSNGDTSISVTLNCNSKTIYKGETLRLAATINGTSASVKWKSSKKKVASVNSSGVVTAKKAGTATITATVNGKKATCTVTVKNPSIKLNKKTASVYVGSTLQLKATVKGKSSKVTWKVNKQKMSSTGTSLALKFNKAGKFTITAAANGKTAKCVVTVKNKSTALTLAKAKKAMTNYIDKHYGLATVEKYNGYIAYDSKSGNDYLFLFRSYTGAYAKFYVNASTGKIYMSERNPFTYEYEAKQYVGNAVDYL